MAAASIPVGCGLATAGLDQAEGTKPHDAAVPDTRTVTPDGPGTDADAIAPPPADGSMPPADASDDAADESTVPDAPPPPPCATGVLFCDGFEQGLGAWPQIEQTNGTIGLDTTHVHRGAHAIRAHENAITQPGGNPNVTIDHTQTWPSHFWVRFFVYAPSPFPPSDAALLNLIDGANNNKPGLQLYLSSDSANVSMTTYNTGDDQNWGSSTTSLLDQWVCFELEADVPNGVLNISMNGTDLTDLDQTGLTLPSPDVTKLGLGFYNPNTQGAYDVWFDDIIVDSQPIGCTK
ncbi:MAG TPA: hypothetical protein VF765_35535 [Polyangiaceae bacterium]